MASIPITPGQTIVHPPPPPPPPQVPKVVKYWPKTFKKIDGASDIVEITEIWFDFEIVPDTFMGRIIKIHKKFGKSGTITLSYPENVRCIIERPPSK